MKNIKFILALALIFMTLSCQNEYETPNEYSAVSWYNSLFNEGNALGLNDYLSFADLSQGALSHSWTIQNENGSHFVITSYSIHYTKLYEPFNIDVLIAQIKSNLEARSMIRHKFGQKMELEPSEVTFTSIDEKLMERLIKVIEANMSNAEFTVAQLATEVGMSQTILNRKLKALIGETANVFIRTIRLKRAAQLLKLDRLSVSDIVYEVGFNDMKYFRECFRKQFDTTPTEYVKKSKE